MTPVGRRASRERGAEDWQHALYEQRQSRLCALHETYKIDYAYAEWRASLKFAIEFNPAMPGTPRDGVDDRRRPAFAEFRFIAKAPRHTDRIHPCPDRGVHVDFRVSH